MTTDQKIIKNKIDVLELANHPGNVSQVCKVLRYLGAQHKGVM